MCLIRIALELVIVGVHARHAMLREHVTNLIVTETEPEVLTPEADLLEEPRGALFRGKALRDAPVLLEDVGGAIVEAVALRVGAVFTSNFRGVHEQLPGYEQPKCSVLTSTR